MKELSIFIDESGDFGEYDYHTPYYIITMVFHNQQEDIQPAVSRLNRELSYLNLNNLCIHTGPIIRKEEIYVHMSVEKRRRIFNVSSTRWLLSSARQKSVTNAFVLKKNIFPMLSKPLAGCPNKSPNSSVSIMKISFPLMM